MPAFLFGGPFNDDELSPWRKPANKKPSFLGQRSLNDSEISPIAPKKLSLSDYEAEGDVSPLSPSTAQPNPQDLLKNRIAAINSMTRAEQRPSGPHPIDSGPPRYYERMRLRLKAAGVGNADAIVNERMFGRSKRGAPTVTGSSMASRVKFINSPSNWEPGVNSASALDANATNKSISFPGSTWKPGENDGSSLSGGAGVPFANSPSGWVTAATPSWSANILRREE